MKTNDKNDKMQITVVEIDNKDLFNGAKVRNKGSKKVREIFVLPEGMTISQAVSEKIFNMETHVEYETVMLNKHLFELVDETLGNEESKPLHTQGEARITNEDNYRFPYVRVIRIGDICIAQTEGETPAIARANAQRIVKCVNEYDKLLETKTEMEGALISLKQILFKGMIGQDDIRKMRDIIQTQVI